MPSSEKINFFFLYESAAGVVNCLLLESAEGFVIFLLLRFFSWDSGDLNGLFLLILANDLVECLCLE